MQMKRWESEWTYVNEISNCQRIRVLSEYDSLGEWECLDELVREAQNERIGYGWNQTVLLYIAECA